MLRNTLLAAVLTVAAAGAAQAAPITYNVTLTGSPYAGSGTITLASAPTTGNQTYTASTGWLGLSLNIDGHDFTLAEENNPGDYVFFQNGKFLSFSYIGTDGTATLQLGSSYIYSDQTVTPQHYTSGKITLALAPVNTAVPEPASIALFAPLAVFAASRIRRKRKAVA